MNRSGHAKTGVLDRLVRLGVVIGLPLLIFAPASSRAVTAVAPDATEEKPAARTAPTMQYSAGIGDILKMVAAKVDAEVVKAYIKNSPIPYTLNASEIIALKEHGV